MAESPLCGSGATRLTFQLNLLAGLIEKEDQEIAQRGGSYVPGLINYHYSSNVKPWLRMVDQLLF
ncbi:hypothetical protein DSECCO2_96790 [anaerobic digester metagenome]